MSLPSTNPKQPTPQESTREKLFDFFYERSGTQTKKARHARKHFCFIHTGLYPRSFILFYRRIHARLDTKNLINAAAAKATINNKTFSTGRGILLN